MRLKKRLKKLFTLKLIMTYFIVFLMLGSVLGFVLSESVDNEFRTTYNGFRVELQGNRYLVSFNRERLEFIFPPQELQYFDVPDGMMRNLQDVPFFTISFDPNMQDNGELGYLRYIFFEYSYKKDKLVGFGITEDSLLYDGISVMNCDDSTRTSPIIVFKDGLQDEISYDQENGCIVVNSTSAIHRVQFAERVIYGILGIIE